MSILEVVRAGAGSGKTTDLCQTVFDAVNAGLDPARILATTFTKKAAAELKGRIQSQLLSGDGQRASAARKAERLELAAIGTVHSVAYQLLCRYAIEMGLSPSLEVLEERAREQALNDLLGGLPEATWQPLVECADRLDVRDLHERVLKLLDGKRGNRIADAEFRTQMADSAVRVCELLAPHGVASAETPIGHLVSQALTNIAALPDTTAATKKACQVLRQIQANRFAVWASYVEAAKIEAGKRSGANDLLHALRTEAGKVRQNPRLHEDIRRFSSLLAEETIRLEAEYRRYKAERGLVDFTDLEILFLELLEDDCLARELSEDFHLVLVDEFQDTNPLQLAIFQRLRKITARSRWVGDPKQAIYGFRGADPQLVNDTWENAPNAHRSSLPNNHRSQRGLVQFVAALFSPVLGEDAKQAPTRPALPRGVERWVFDTKNQQDDAKALACGIAKLHAEGIRLGDIVVLERTNRLLSPLAEALEYVGIPYLLESPGLLATREGALVLSGLRLVADRNDSLAAATILHLLSDPEKETPDWIIERLGVLRQADAAGENGGAKATYHTPWPNDPRFSRIEAINRGLLSPRFVVQQVIEALEVPTLVCKWGEPARRCANLDSIVRHACEYEEIASDRAQAITLNGLILHLEQLAVTEKDFRFPPQGHDAVTLMTYHAAKGLEWPVVVLSGFGSTRAPDMWAPIVTGGGRNEDDPLQGRVLQSWVWPFGEIDGQFGGLRKGSGLEGDALSCLEGQAREKQERDENLRLLYVGCTRAKQKLVFAHREGKYDWLAQLQGIDSLLDPSLNEGENELPGVDTTFVLRRINAAMLDDCRVEKSQQERWLLLPRSSARTFAARFYSPSDLAEGAGAAEFTLEKLPGPSYFPSGAAEDQYAAIGDAVHSFLAATPSMRSLSSAEKERVAERCLAAFSVSGVLPSTALVSAAERLCQWVETNYPGAAWHTEVAVSGPRSAGGHWNGAIDLLLQLPSGELVLIDHKSAPIRPAQCADKAAQYSGQLDAYCDALSSAGELIQSVWVHFPLAGVLARRQ